jgi:hypothetical protein
MLNVVMLVGKVKKQPTEIMNGKMKSFMLTTWNINQKTGQRYETHHIVDVLGRINLPPMSIGDTVCARGSLNRRSSEKNGEKVWFTSVTAFEVTADAGGATAQAFNGGSTPAPPAAYPPAPPSAASDEEDYF